MTRELSDHTPLLLTAGQQHFRGNSKEFRFELGWLLRDDFFDIVAPVWQSENRGNTPMARWQNKIRRTRRFLRGWAKNLVSQTRSKKCELISKLDVIDLKAESSVLSSLELDERCHLKGQLQKNLREEELYWLQRAKETRLLHGDENTKYFQLVANGKHRKKQIFQLEQEEGVITGNENLQTYITNFYSNLFGPHEENYFSLDEEIREDLTQVTEQENEFLTAAFTEKEIHDAVFQMEANKAPGPDGFPAEFYQFFWEIVKTDLIQIFQAFHKGELPIHSLNFGIITLLPKSTDALCIQQFRPICLLNVSFKIFTKVLNNRVTSIADRIISPYQSAFIPGRFILDGVVTLHETLHELQRKKEDAVVLKLDFEKA